MLNVKNVTMQFGGLTAVSDFNIHVDAGEIVGLIGPNGAGKTTIFNAITGMYTPTKGEIFLGDKNITGMAPHLITASGIARTFQNIRLFGKLSVLENIMVACWLREKPGLVESVLHLPGYLAKEKRSMEFAREMLDTVGLLENADDVSVSLPYGKQRRLEIVRALATGPKLLLLDKPAAGMNPQESYDLMNFIVAMRDKFKISVFLIEHHMQVVMGICTRLYVLDYGITIAEGTPAEIQKNHKVIDAYLGVGDA